MKKTAFLLLFFLTLAPVLARPIVSTAFAADIKMRVVLVNPSQTKKQTKSVRNYLPKEVTLKDIVDDGGLNIEYDTEQGLLFAYKDNIELAPLETKSFEIVLADVWMIPEDKILIARQRVDGLMGHLSSSPQFEQASLIAKTVYGRLDEILRTQNDLNVTRQQHIGYYRDNLSLLEKIQADIEQLEKLLIAVSGTLTPDLTSVNAELEGPTRKTTWVIIFIILIFVAILAGAFYFTWQQQAKVTENIFLHEKEMTFSELSKSKPEKLEEKDA